MRSQQLDNNTLSPIYRLLFTPGAADKKLDSDGGD